MPDLATEPWTPELAALWARMASHDFEPPHALSFARRLARDRAWPIAFARAAVGEYARFCFLAVAGPAPMTPSEEVDEVWHLHLTYSRDYWDVWCGEVLRVALHHDPTQGGPVERQRYRRQYAATLQRYEEFFGPPPETFWPATRHRFQATPRYRVLDRARWFAIRRPSSWLRRARA